MTVHELDPAADYDSQRRKIPHRLGFVQFARAIPGYVNQFTRRVPDDMYAQAAAGVVDVACPCSETPRCPMWTPVRCGCGRTFVYTGREVRVAPVSE